MLNLPLAALGPWEIAGIVVIVLVVFGAGRLAGVGRALGQGVRDFRQEASAKPGDGKDAGPSGETKA